MKKESLIRSLARVEVPEMFVVGHKERLRCALLGLQKAEKPSINISSESFASVFRDAWNYWRHPFWRTAIAGLVVIMLIASLVALSYFIMSPSPAVVAADIVKNDQDIQKALGGSGEILILQVDVNENTARVVCGRGVGDFIEVDVDMVGRNVITARRFEGIYLSELPLASQDQAVKIAWENTQVKSLVSKGATFGKVFPVFTRISSATIIDNNMVKITPASSVAIVPVQIGQKIWLVQVNLDEGKIESIIEPQLFIKPDCIFASKQDAVL